jgi:hypothetical protein
VTSRLDAPDTGRARRYFKLTRRGIAALEANHVEHVRLWQGLGRLLRTRNV